MSLEEGLVLYWACEDNNSQPYISDSHSGYVGEAYRDTQDISVTGKINNGFEFNGSGDIIQLNHKIIPESDDFTISVWVEVSSNVSSGDDRVLFQFGDYDNRTYFYSTTDFGDADNEMRLWDINEGQILYGGAIKGQGWKHVVLKRDNDTFYLYLDNSIIDSNSTNISFSGTDYFEVGGGDEEDRYHYGKIDELGIWDKALSDDEISELYNDGNGITYNDISPTIPTILEVSREDEEMKIIWEYITEDISYDVYLSQNNQRVFKYTDYKEQLWEYGGLDTGGKLDGSVETIAVIPNEYIFTGDENDDVHKITKDGDNVWIYSEPESDVKAVAVDKDGNCYAGSSDNNLYKITPDGQRDWIYRGSDTTIQDIIIGNDGYIYFGNWSGEVYKLDKDGNLQNSFSVPSGWVWSIRLDLDGNIYTGCSGDYDVYKFDNDGNLIWTFSEPDDVNDSLAIDLQNNIYIGNRNENAYKVDKDGTKIWEFTECNGRIYDLDIDKNKNIYLASGDDYIYKINDNITPTDGSSFTEYEWRATVVVGNWPEAVATDAGSIIFW